MPVSSSVDKKVGTHFATKIAIASDWQYFAESKLLSSVDSKRYADRH